jgi:hypothetical protein
MKREETRICASFFEYIQPDNNNTNPWPFKYGHDDGVSVARVYVERLYLMCLRSEAFRVQADAAKRMICVIAFGMKYYEQLIFGTKKTVSRYCRIERLSN